MRKYVLFFAFSSFFLLMGGEGRAQSLKDLLNKDNISKIMDAVSGNTGTVEMVGTWSYNGSAIELEADNLLAQAGGAAAASVAESELDEQLNKIGISVGEMSFTFNSDSTFTSAVGNHPINGTYSYNASTKELNIKILKLLNINAKMNYYSDSMELLFKSDKLLALLSAIASKTNSTALQTLGSLADSYEGMMVGFKLKKQQ